MCNAFDCCFYVAKEVWKLQVNVKVVAKKQTLNLKRSCYNPPWWI